MKRQIIFFISLLFTITSCVKMGKSIQGKEYCPSEYVWINYVGITDKIKKFILIRTCEKDISYYSIYKKDWPGFFNDKDFFDIYCNNLIVDSITFNKIKEYVKSNNTYKQENIANTDNHSAIKINFADKKDSLTYIVNKENPDFFKNLKCSLNIENDDLINSLEYYHEILNSTKD